VQYEVHRLSSPERIYFDLHDTVLAPGLNGTSIDVVNDLLSRIRVAQAAAGVARVVLDTRNASNFTVGLEPNPYRLIIEIRRGRSEPPPKTNIDLIRSSSSSPKGKLMSSTPPLSKEDRLFRRRVPHLRIVVDAGHGGWDLGTVGRQGIVEKDLVLDISRRLGKLLEGRLGSEILYTRSEDAFVPLEERAEIANDAQADLFVSIHANNSDYPSARGVETYYTNVSAPANSGEIEKRDAITRATVPSVVFSQVGLKERTEQSRHLAASVEHALYGCLSTKNPAIRDRGVKEADFMVLTGTTMPAVLAEISFVSSPADERNLQSSPYREQIAEALYKGITHYAAASGHMKLARVR
jgi:N-acetylmuramoyl-L-alanine amidase